MVCFFYLQAQGQQRKIDSLLSLLKNDQQDTLQVKHLYGLCWEYYKVGEYDRGLYYGNTAMHVSDAVPFGSGHGWPKGKAKAYNNMGVIYESEGNYEKALENYVASLNIKKKIGDKHGMANSYGNIGNVYDGKGDYDKALEKYGQALKLFEELGEKNGISNVYGNIGVIYGHQSNYVRALENYSSALKIKQEIGDKRGEGMSYNNIGTIYEAQGKYEQALANEIAALKIREKIGDKQGTAQSYNNIGHVYANQGKYEKALQSQFASLKIDEEIGDKRGVATCCNDIGYLYLKQNKIGEATKQAEKSLKLAIEIGSKNDIKLAAGTLSECDSASGNWKEAYLHHILFKEYNDSVFNAEGSRKSAEMNARYESEKKESQINLLEKDKEKQTAVSNAESRRQKTILTSVVCGLSLMILFSGFMYNRWHITRRQKKIIEKQKKLVDEQKELVEEKNKDITDSINYAKRIQQAKLPRKDDILGSFPQSFVLFKPKDIVSGDFYFFHKTKETIFIAAADCTGHGVPGAFMSMIGSDKLEEAVLQSSDTSEILKRLNQAIKTALRQSDNIESTRDGMDIALCAVNMTDRTMEFAGANRPLWIIRSGQKQVEETKATKHAIAGFTGDDQQFTSHRFSLQQGDTFYIFTDGYADLFGGPKDKKITTSKLKEILLSIQDKTMEEQEHHLNNFAENWKARTEQVDDILIVGVRM
jgi:serine phosphatase RsbU (regulator of sigma subunit)/Tfp pilus assembly protein PilF